MLLLALPPAGLLLHSCAHPITYMPPLHPGRHLFPAQGAGVVDTIRSGITNISYFYDSPDVLAYGEQQ